MKWNKNNNNNSTEPHTLRTTNERTNKRKVCNAQLSYIFNFNLIIERKSSFEHMSFFQHRLGSVLNSQIIMKMLLCVWCAHNSHFPLGRNLLHFFRSLICAFLIALFVSLWQAAMVSVSLTGNEKFPLCVACTAKLQAFNIAN